MGMWVMSGVKPVAILRQSMLKLPTLLAHDFSQRGNNWQGSLDIPVITGYTDNVGKRELNSVHMKECPEGSLSPL